MTEKIIFLGGQDLEMATIKQLLHDHGIRYYDKKLTWNNANLEEYTEELNLYGDNAGFEIYGIELQEKNVPHIPANYHRIDHHNDGHLLPSSLEQLAAILNIRLNREQQLIAANDKGYIPAMEQLGASRDEIEYIRRKDREAQGVSKQDELMAEKAVNSKTIEDGIIVIHAETHRFSPITDRLFPFEKLLIYTDEELMYYGNGKSQLAEQFKEQIKQGAMFHGGNENGYVGTARGVFTPKEIEVIKNTIIREVAKI